MKPLDTSDKGVRKFGVVLAVFFAILAGFSLWKGHRPYVTGALSVFFFVGLACPSMLRPVQKVWMGFAFFMGKIVTTVILTSIYIFFITPLAFVSRVCGIDFLRPKRDNGADTYWVPSDITQDDTTRYTQQF